MLMNIRKILSLQNRVTICRSIAAGMMIGLGATIKLSCSDPIVGAFLFSIGLFYICSQGMYLFTGKIGNINKDNYREMILIWIFNFIGCAIICLPLRFVIPNLHVESVNLLARKVTYSWYKIAVLSFCCGIIMYLAVDISNKYMSGTIKTFSVVIGVMVFILSGFEHSIANMAYSIFFVRDYTLLFCIKMISISTIFNGIGSVFIKTLMKGNMINVKNN